MATLPNGNLTLLDLAKRANPDGSVDTQIVELLNQQNEVLLDMNFIQGNLETGHKTTVRTGIPEATWRRFNQGVQPKRSTSAQITFNAASLENYSEVDAALANLNGDVNALRFTEDMAIVEGMQQELARTVFYGNEKLNPSEFTGLSYYYNDPTADSGANLINGDNAGSDTDYGSIWLVGWSDTTITGIVPKHSTAGLMMENKGLVTLDSAPDGGGGRMEAYRTFFKQESGMAVRDWRYAVRICNIRRGELTSDASGNSADLPDLMFTAVERMQSLSGVRPVFYMDRKMREFLRKQLAAKTASSTLTSENVGGVRTDVFDGIPLRRVDALGATESLITGF